MAITVIPSTNFWSMLPQIAQNAVGTYWQAQDRKLAKEEKERLAALQQLGILQGMAEQGGDVNSQMDELLAKIGLPNAKAPETGAQLRERILRTPDIEIKPTERLSVVNPQRLTMAGSVSPDGKATLVQQRETQRVDAGKAPDGPKIVIKSDDRFTDNQYRKAGMPTRHERLREQTEASGFHVTQYVNGIRQRAAQGEPVNAYEAALAGIKTPGQVTMANAQETADYVRSTAGAYIKDLVAQQGGRVEPSQIQQTISTAYDDFMRRFGSMIPPEQRTNAQAMFGEAMYEVLNDQSKLALERDKLSLQRTLGFMRTRPNDPDVARDLVNQLNRVADSIRRDLEMEFGTNRMQMMMEMMQRGADPKTASQTMPGYDRFVEQMGRLTAARNAATMASRNMTDDPAVLQALEQVLEVPSLGGATGPAPAGVDPYAQYRNRGDGRIRVSPQAKRDMQIRGVWDDTKYVEAADGLGFFSNSGPQ